MKLAIAGKGGAGKTTIASMIARTWAKDGYEVLAIDADPDSDLPFALGFDYDSAPKISEMRALIKERTGGAFFRLDPEVNDILDKYSVRKGNLRLLVLGAIQEADKGCACPENAFLKALLRHIVLSDNQRVIVDFEAGIEHLGRGAAAGIDVMLIVVEPIMTSVNSYRRIRKLAKELGIKKILALGNKARDESDREFLSKNIPEDEILMVIPFSDELEEASRVYSEQLPMAGVWQELAGI